MDISQPKVISTVRPHQLSYGWVILVVSFLTIFTTVSLRFSFGLFFSPIESDLGWDRTILSAAVAINMIVYGIFQPIAGRIADRFGPKWVIILSTVLIGAGLVFLSQASAVWHLYLAYGLIVGVGIGGAAFVTQAALISNWFVRRRSLALGIAMGGSSAGLVLLVPAIVFLLLTFGWRSTVLILGLTLIALIVPLNLILVRDRPKRDALEARGSATVASIMDLSASQAIRTRPFWLLASGFSVCGFSITMISVHLPGHVNQLGLSPTVAATTLSALGVASITGSVLVGALASRIEPRLLLASAYFIRGLAVVLLVQATEPIHFWLFAIFGGLGWLATVPLTSGLTASLFGRASMATIFGLVSLGHQIGDAFGALIGGVLYDLTGNYQLPFMLVAALLLAASTISLLVDERATRQLRNCAT